MLRKYAAESDRTESLIGTTLSTVTDPSISGVLSFGATAFSYAAFPAASAAIASPVSAKVWVYDCS